VRVRTDDGARAGGERGLGEGRWRAFSNVERSTPQWNAATTTSASRRAARTPAAIAGNVALEVLGLPGDAKNDAGPMSLKPTNAIRSPSRVIVRGRRAAGASPPRRPARRPLRAPRARCPAALACRSRPRGYWRGSACRGRRSGRPRRGGTDARGRCRFTGRYAKDALPSAAAIAVLVVTQRLPALRCNATGVPGGAPAARSAIVTPVARTAGPLSVGA